MLIIFYDCLLLVDEWCTYRAHLEAAIIFVRLLFILLLKDFHRY